MSSMVGGRRLTSLKATEVELRRTVIARQVAPKLPKSLISGLVTRAIGGDRPWLGSSLNAGGQWSGGPRTRVHRGVS
jgi:hypothetical protein